ncbi:MAG: PhoU domain-containing protein [Planctomycetota bacterium]
MIRHEERLEADLQALKKRLRDVSADVEKAVRDAIQALLTLDRDLASDTILGDMHINRETREIDKLCHAFVARHFPSAGILRFISSALRMDVALERVGDYAATICRETLQLREQLSPEIAKDIGAMADQSRNLLEQALRAFNEEDADAAKETISLAKHASGMFDRLMEELIHESEEGRRPVRDLFELVLILIRIERISAQSKNICEETVFHVKGLTKQPKTYRILFLDRKNDVRSQLAEAFARKAFPQSGIYSSAGWEPAEKIDPALVEFMDRYGLSARDASPHLLEHETHQLAKYHVIVGLEDGAHDRIGRLPYKTVFQNWGGQPLKDASSESFEAAYKEIAPKVRDLMEALQGSG